MEFSTSPTRSKKVQHRTTLEKEINRNNNTLYDINRVLLRISLLAFFFSIFTELQEFQNIEINTESKYKILAVLGCGLYAYKSNFGKSLQLYSLILICSHLLIPIVRTLTAEISSDTIYMYFIHTQIIFVIDSIKSALRSSSKFIIEKSEFEPLCIEESINAMKKDVYNGIVGSTASLLGFILLSSRLATDESVFCLLCLSLIIYVFCPYCFESISLHNSFAGTLLFIIFTFTVLAFLNTLISQIYFLAICFFYITGFSTVYTLNRKKV